MCRANIVGMCVRVLHESVCVGQNLSLCLRSLRHGKSPLRLLCPCLGRACRHASVLALLKRSCPEGICKDW